MSQKPEDPPKQEAPQEERWSLSDGPTFHRSLPEDATEEEKADFIRYPWFYNWFAKDDAPVTYGVTTFKRSQAIAEQASVSDTAQPTTDAKKDAQRNSVPPHASAPVDRTPDK